jgi:molybdenum cofactor cytidylyltransferase
VIAGIVLAGGGSSRLGSPKQLVLLKGRTLLVHAADCCLSGGCEPVIVVLGASRETIEPTLSGLPVRVVVNEDWREGIASSIRAGISALPDGVEALVLATCDQPELEPDVVRRLIKGFDGTPGRMVACAYGGTVGVPALFGRDRFEGLLQLRGDSGARQLLRGNLESVVRVPWSGGAFDLDLPSDREKI